MSAGYEGHEPPREQSRCGDGLPPSSNPSPPSSSPGLVRNGWRYFILTTLARFFVLCPEAP
jgi:hypothetical protein